MKAIWSALFLSSIYGFFGCMSEYSSSLIQDQEALIVEEGFEVKLVAKETRWHLRLMSMAICM